MIPKTCFGLCEDLLILSLHGIANIWIFICLKSPFITWIAYFDPVRRPAPSWLVSSGGRALHRYFRGHGFKFRTGLKFLQVSFTTTRFSSVLSCEDLLLSSYFGLLATAFEALSLTSQQNSVSFSVAKYAAFILIAPKKCFWWFPRKSSLFGLFAAS